ncbi:hypothetical protein H920_16805 [Fukomys damarensis]|uniref:Uncharacterized protein n=1 Tax=Fukomys damarensis TaxID=885580 RepID=A0A091CUL6_FUKDA|nr:hypothetical protein H920_16805 [Fukomys damarensis]
MWRDEGRAACSGHSADDSAPEVAPTLVARKSLLPPPKRSGQLPGDAPDAQWSRVRWICFISGYYSLKFAAVRLMESIDLDYLLT